MAKKLAVLPFNSWKGNRYLYDDCTGAIIPSWPLLERALLAHAEKSLEETAQELVLTDSTEEVRQTCSFIQLWEDSFGAFYRKPEWNAETYPWLFNFPEEEIQKFAQANMMQLILILTENCNLRCRYCIFSDHYPLTHSYTSKRMSLEIAQRAVDYFFSLTAPFVSRIPGKKLGITFYGGEPLLEFKLLRQIVVYIKEHAPCDIVFNISTNATLLTAEIADFLVENEFNIAFSMDGPQEEQDRNRVFVNGEGTFDTVWENVQSLKRRHPDFRSLMFLSVFDWRTQLDKVAHFYAEYEENLASTGFVNSVSDTGNTYYQQFMPEEHTNFQNQHNALWNDYVQNMLNDQPLSPYTRSFFDLSMAGVSYRNRINDTRFPPFPIGGCCVPGMKLAVQPDGKIDICERVNGTSPIGHLDTGLDIGRIKGVISEYNRTITANCFDCETSKLCSLCFALCNTDGSFELSKDACKNMKASSLEHLQTYCSVLEEKPDAFDRFDKDLLANWLLNR